MTKKILLWGSLAGAIGLILTLIFLICPDCKPEPYKPPTPPPQMGAELTNLSLEYRVTFADYLRSERLPADRYNPADLSYQGMIIRFTAKVSGFRGQTCKVRGAVHDAQAGSKSYELPYERTLIPEADDDRAGSQLWVPNPDSKGYFFVRLELYDPKGTLLDYADSSPFIVN